MMVYDMLIRLNLLLVIRNPVGLVVVWLVKAVLGARDI